ncbi:chemotaxis protein CheW [Alkaliphilus sp. MSJ-5]|uniref:Chemotaxis protein CheW n=1 Tax=Alkaliphilus flagellatus TaxID=2841507 RepID=A0ABS6G085_9FIRM|nr:chemotaxis protein CheW [Alkaliphilus flagellatus]MBU5675619.1 chemotaxis protein CheW [Alkaliphilus flagellatus]
MSERQYVIFKLENEEYAVDIMNVKEISEYMECTKVPNSPNFIKGIINYRGNVVPVINLREKFDMLSASITPNTRIIIFGLNDKQVGLLVDDASQVLTIDDTKIEDAPNIIMGSDDKFISGIGKIENRMVIILDLENLLSEEEKKRIEAI